MIDSENKMCFSKTSNELVSRWIQPDAYRSIARSDIEQYETRLTREPTPLTARETLLKMCSGC